MVRHLTVIYGLLIFLFTLVVVIGVAVMDIAKAVRLIWRYLDQSEGKQP